MRLNGWQRLWIFISVAWVLVVLGFAIQSMRSEEERYSRWSNELLEYVASQAPELQGRTTASLRAAYVTLTDKQLVEAMHDAYLVKHPAYRFGFSSIDEKYSQPNGLGVTQVKTLVMIGLIPPLLVYVLGLGLVWVRRGFKQEPAEG